MVLHILFNPYYVILNISSENVFKKLVMPLLFRFKSNSFVNGGAKLFLPLNDFCLPCYATVP